MEECLPSGCAVVEGVRNSVSIKDLAERYKIEMPICIAVYQVLHEGVSCTQALQKLLERVRPDKEIHATNFAKISGLQTSLIF